MVTGTPFGIMMTGLGVISLAGVVVNNAIVLLDYIEQLRERGLDVKQALIRAGYTRFPSRGPYRNHHGAGAHSDGYRCFFRF